MDRREQLPIRGNTRGRRGSMMRTGQRVHYSDQEGNDDRNDRSLSPDEIPSRIETINNERSSDTRETKRDNYRRRMRETTQHLN
jgi:hypothetical protein